LAEPQQIPQCSFRFKAAYRKVLVGSVTVRAPPSGSSSRDCLVSRPPCRLGTQSFSTHWQNVGLFKVRCDMNTSAAREGAQTASDAGSMAERVTTAADSSNSMLGRVGATAAAARLATRLVP